MTAIRLTRAFICTACDLVIDGWARCPQCGKSEALWPLALWIRPLEGAAPNDVVRELDAISAVRAKR